MLMAVRIHPPKGRQPAEHALNSLPPMRSRRSRSRPLFFLAAALATAAVACRLTFHLLGSHVDSNGVLREPFALLPISALLLLASATTAAGAWVVQRRQP